MTISAMQKKADAAEREYRKTLDKLAANLRKEYLVPYCDKHKLRFRAGMGGWVFIAEDGNAVTTWHMERMPATLRKGMEAVLLFNCSLGELIEDYTYKGYVNWAKKEKV